MPQIEKKKFEKFHVIVNNALPAAKNSNYSNNKKIARWAGYHGKCYFPHYFVMRKDFNIRRGGFSLKCLI